MKTCVVLALFLMAGVSLADIQKRIIGCTKCEGQEEKHFVFLETRNPTHITICSGSVIGNGLWVLTAAHCDMGGPSFTVKSADRSKKQTVDHAQTFKHPTADVMLLKLSQRLTPIPLATPAKCTALRTKLNPNNPVTFRITARDTQAQADYDKRFPYKVRPDESPDGTKCANIIVDRLGPANLVLEHTGAEQTSHNERFFARPSAGCRMSKGDAGAGYIYINALYAVIHGWGLKDGTTIVNSKDLIGFTVCDTVSEWITDTMIAHP